MSDKPTADDATEAFRRFEGAWIDRWDGVAEFPDRLAIFRAGWDAAYARVESALLMLDEIVDAAGMDERAKHAALQAIARTRMNAKARARR